MCFNTASTHHVNHSVFSSRNRCFYLTYSIDWSLFVYRYFKQYMQLHYTHIRSVCGSKTEKFFRQLLGNIWPMSLMPVSIPIVINNYYLNQLGTSEFIVFKPYRYSRYLPIHIPKCHRWKIGFSPSH